MSRHRWPGRTFGYAHSYMTSQEWANCNKSHDAPPHNHPIMVPVAYVDGWCRIAGIVIDEWFLDMGAGAAMHERPQGNALLDRVEPGDAILVFDASEIASTQEKGDQLVRLTNIKQVMLVATAVVDATFFV